MAVLRENDEVIKTAKTVTFKEDHNISSIQTNPTSSTTTTTTTTQKLAIQDIEKRIEERYRRKFQTLKQQTSRQIQLLFDENRILRAKLKNERSKHKAQNSLPRENNRIEDKQENSNIFLLANIVFYILLSIITYVKAENDILCRTLQTVEQIFGEVAGLNNVKKTNKINELCPISTFNKGFSQSNESASRGIHKRLCLIYKTLQTQSSKSRRDYEKINVDLAKASKHINKLERRLCQIKTISARLSQVLLEKNKTITRQKRDITNTRRQMNVMKRTCVNVLARANAINIKSEEDIREARLLYTFYTNDFKSDICDRRRNFLPTHDTSMVLEDSGKELSTASFTRTCSPLEQIQFNDEIMNMSDSREVDDSMLEEQPNFGEEAKRALEACISEMDTFEQAAEEQFKEERIALEAELEALMNVGDISTG